MKIPSILEMLQAGVHFGHKNSRWYPKMKPFIFTQRNQVHIMDLEKTKAQLEIVLPQIKQMVLEGKQILFISTKPQAKAIVRKAAEDCGMPFLVDRWIGGMLTNFSEIKKLVKNYVILKDQQDKGQLGKYTKKEQLEIGKKIGKMDKYLSGLVTLNSLPDAVFIPSMQCEKIAVSEANRMNISVIGVCDTNANPNKAEYIIPANDDAVRSIEMMVGLVRDVIKEGVEEKGKDIASVKVEDKKVNSVK
ncbi:MAG: 30S ribosomal protein S2 [Candidatus Magasanikbacteria bacterium CG_4_10_14_0_8_um_filter_32_14]|uniref:Small ribosomal subunit protein uS2 n=2 Tax=Candidatus Magasanikiibacteriota TaxID=1752731 RepID=A0A2M7R9Q7_9BACT|nr:MAG: 30S ribosomal protein S2 [Candidatus Magasanikbacteria bacterium CG1_02_32_51]PIY93483.1 MAG: 30S ribosomal protein S2 [Candidatus Magasanikbacteria bacterium CG_4_10_14_0_8_um_filter_32_14]